MKKGIVFAVAAAMILLLSGAGLLYGELTKNLPEETLTGESMELPTAPGFTVFDHYGMQVELEAFRGKPVVLNFWASWCGPCKNEMPDFEKAYQEFGEDVHFLMVNLTDGYQGETREQAQSFIKDTGYTFPVYYDLESSAAIAYGVTSVPRTYFIDAEGKLVTQAGGMISYELLRQGLEMIRK